MDVQLQELIDRIKAEGLEAAQEQARQLQAEAQAKSDEIVAAAHKTAAQIVAEGREQATRFEHNAREALTQAGRDLLNGLLAGIREKRNQLRGILQNVANVIPGWLKKWLGIGSPAKVMIPLGVAIPEGIGVGVLEGMRTLTQRTLPRMMRRMNPVTAIANVITPAPALQPVLAGAVSGAPSGATYTFNFNEPVYVRDEQDVKILTRRIVREIQRHGG